MHAATLWETVAQWSEIVGGIAFVIVAIWMFRKWILPSIEKTTQRKNAELLDLEQHRDQLRERVAKAQDLIAQADRDAADIGTRALNDARREREAIVSDGRREGTNLVAGANGELDRARNRVRDRLRIEFIEKALQRAREIAIARLDPTLDAQLMQRTVDDVAAERR